MTESPDLQFCDVGPFLICTPETEAGQTWLADNIGEDATRAGETIYIEHRYLEDIVLGARVDGLICHG